MGGTWKVHSETSKKGGPKDKCFLKKKYPYRMCRVQGAKISPEVDFIKEIFSSNYSATKMKIVHSEPVYCMHW